MSPTKKPVAKKQPLTLAQLAAYDDILTDALVDHVSTFSDAADDRKKNLTEGIGVLLDDDS